MQDNKKPNVLSEQESNIPSVASVSETKKKIAMFAFFVVVVLAVAWTFLSGDEEIEKKDKKSAQTGINPNWEDKEAIQNESKELATARVNNELRELQQKLTLEKLAEEQKIYRLRQNAPTKMYSADGKSMSSSMVIATNTDSSGAPISNKHASNPLPLTHDQINNLKKAMGQGDSNKQFQSMAENSGVETVQASRIAHTAYTVTQGTLIPGILQTAINSDLPGMVKANTSIDVYAQSGDRVLIPKGSTLIGEYSSGLSMGQQRLMVMWTRLIRPDGVNVMLGSPGTDTLGMGGLGANVTETHFWARFGQASLLSILGTAIATAGVSPGDQYNSEAAYRTALANNFQQTSGASLMATMNIKPTLHVNQGERINVFVNRDLSFYDVLASSY